MKSCCNPEGSKKIINFLSDLPLETIVDIQGLLATAEVRSCSQDNIEMQVQRCYVVSRAPTILPFLLEDAARSDDEIAASQNTDKPLAAVYQVSVSFPFRSPFPRPPATHACTHTHEHAA